MRKYVDFVEGTDSRAVAGASVVVYTYPGNTLATLYSDNSGTPLANPVKTDATGEYSFYVANGRYSLEISGGGLVTKTITDVAIFDPDDVFTAATAASGAAASASAASTSETNAANSATSAANSATNAANSATNAQTYASAAATGAKFYDTIALGNAGVADGATFGVKAGGSDGLTRPTIYRRDSAGVQTLICSILPASEFDALVVAKSPAGAVFAIVDADGIVSFYVLNDGTVVMGAMTATTATIGQVIMTTFGTAGSTFSDVVPSGYLWSVTDTEGILGIGLTTDGQAVMGDTQIKSINGVSVAQIIAGGGGSGAVTPTPTFSADIEHVLSYGQSRGAGADAIPIQTTAQRFNNLMFDRGMRPDGQPAPAALVPLVEAQQTISTSTFGETILGGMTDMVRERILTDHSLSYTQHQYQLMGSAPALSGTAIAGLAKPSAGYTRLSNDLTSGYSLAQAAGKTYKVRAFTWMQGESDYQASTAGATYQAAFIQLRSDVSADVKALTGQSEEVICISDQVCDHSTYGHDNDPYIALIQLSLAKSQPYFYLSAPTYMVTPNGVHHGGPASQIMGAYAGIVYDKVIVRKEDWKPLMFLSATRQGKLIDLLCNVPKPPLAVDTSVAVVSNYGFTLVDSGGNPLTISSVAVNWDSIRITASANIPAGAKLRYGWVGGFGGNIRDSQGNTIIFGGGGRNFPMHNWMVIDQITLA